MPTTDFDAEFSAGTIREISHDLETISGWVKRIGWIGMVSTIAIFMLAASMLFIGFTDTFIGRSGHITTGLALTVAGTIFLYPSLKLLSYNRRIFVFRKTRSLSDLLLVMNDQKAFWRFATVAIVTVAVIFVAAFVRPPT